MGSGAAGLALDAPEACAPLLVAGEAVEACGAGVSGSSADASDSSGPDARAVPLDGLPRPPFTPPMAVEVSVAPLAGAEAAGVATAMTAAIG